MWIGPLATAGEAVTDARKARKYNIDVMVCKEDCPCLHASSALTVGNGEAPPYPPVPVLVFPWKGTQAHNVIFSLSMLQALSTPDNRRFSGDFNKLFGN